LDAGVDGAVVDQGAADVVDEVGAVETACAQLGDLADATARRVLVALATGLGVVDGAQPLVDFLSLVEVRASDVELGLGDETVGLVVEARGGFGG
jgi:hypothetical protein